MNENIVIIGAGNLGTQLALALSRKGIAIKQVFSRNALNANLLASKINSKFTDNPREIDTCADLYLVAVKDSAIIEILDNMQFNDNQLVAHTAGSVPMSIIEGHSSNYGVFYPLQTFSKNREADFREIPICIEANNTLSFNRLKQLAEQLSAPIHAINSEERKTLHLAAVFANNFVNHFYTIADNILNNKQLSFDLLKPLIRETAAKIQSMSPADAQTGPAKRGDQSIAEAQLNMLAYNPEFRKIYSFVTESIYQFHKKQQDDLL